jgi:hypothetical protein
MKYYYREQPEEDEIGGECSTHGSDEKILVGKT